jgi:hypothetical protein
MHKNENQSMCRIYALIILLIVSANVDAQTKFVPPDPEIEQYVSTVNADSLRHYIETLAGFGTRHTLSTTTDPKSGIGAARQWVLTKFNQFAARSGGRLTARLDRWTEKANGRRITRDAELANVVATLKGTDEQNQRIYIISAHLDSRASDVNDSRSAAPGANDDASGVAAVLEAARILSGSRFSGTIVFVAFTGEEQGLFGGSHMAAVAANEKWNVQAVLNNDIIGNSLSSGTGIRDNTTVRVFSEGLPFSDTGSIQRDIRRKGLENDGESRQLARYIHEICNQYVRNLNVKLVYRSDRFLRGGDQMPFLEKGFPAIRITETNENYPQQHQDLRTENGIEYGDLPKFIDYEYLRKNTALNIAALASMAKAPSRPGNVKLNTSGLTNETSISWSRSPGAQSYTVLMRETSSPVWQRSFTTSRPEIVLPHSKDNYFFGVSAVSETGNPSVPVIAE